MLDFREMMQWWEEKYSQHYTKAKEYSEKNDGTFRIETGVLERLHSLAN